MNSIKLNKRDLWNLKLKQIILNLISVFQMITLC